MADSAPIKSSEVVQPNLFVNTSKSAKVLLKELNKLEKGFKDIKKESDKLLKNSSVIDSADKLKLVNKELDKSKDARIKLVEVQKKQVVVKEKLKQLTVAEIKNKLKTQQQNKAIKDSLKDIIALENKNLGTLQKLALNSKRLRKERERLNLDTKKGSDRLKEINKQLDLNNKKVLENSDKLKKQRLNVGNYTDSIKEAAGASGLFGGVLSKLNAIQGVVNALLKSNTASVTTNTAAKEANAVATVQMTTAQKGLTAATAAGTKALKGFKIALAATGIGALLLAIGGLVAFFTRAQDGADKLSTGLAGVGAAVDVIIDRFSLFGEGLSSIFNGDFQEGLELMKNAFEGIGEELEKDIKLATDLKTLTIQLTREQKLFEAQQSSTITRIKELTIVTKDKLQADLDRLKAVKDINELEIELTDQQLKLSERALAASLDSISADRTKLELGAEQLSFIERIKNGQIDAAEAVKLAADFTLSSAAGEEALFDVLQKVIELEQARQSLLDKQATTAKRTASITQQIANKNSTALLQQAAAQREFFKDQDESIDNRITFIEKARDLEIEAFKVRADANLINEAELQAVVLKLNKRTIEQIQKLRDIEIQKEIKRRLQLEKELQEGLAAIRKDVAADLNLKETELLELENLNNQGLANEEEIARKELEIQQFKLDSIIGNERSTHEEIRRAQAEFDAFEIDAAKEQADKLSEIAKERQDKVIDSLKDITSAIGEELSKVDSLRSKKRREEISENEQQLTKQEELASKGLDNELAFRRKRQAELELQQRQAEEREQRRQEAIRSVETFFGFLKARLNEKDADPATAGFKAVADTLLAKTLAKSIVQFAAGGNDDIQGAGTTTSDSIPFMLSKHEGVVKASANMQNKGVVKSLNDGSFSDMYIPKYMYNEANNGMVQVTSVKEKIDPTIHQNEEIINLLKKSNARPVHHVDWDKHGVMREKVYREGRVDTIKHMSSKKRL